MSGIKNIRNKNNILITGGTGFIGKSLIPLLIKRGEGAIVLSRHKKVGQVGVQYVAGDLLRPSSFKYFLKDARVVVHLASEININYSLEHPRDIIEKNISMTFNLLEALRVLREKPLFIFTSTDRVYGKTFKKLVDENEPPFPIEPYTASKIMSEILISTYSHLYGIPFIVLRLDSVYGPHQTPTMFISDVIKKMITLEKFKIGHLNINKNFLYVTDAAGAILKSMRAKPAAYNQVYNIGGRYVSVKQVFKILKEIAEQKLHKKIKTQFDPLLVRHAGAEVNPFRLNCAKAARMLGWKPKVDLTHGLEETLLHILNTFHHV